MHITDPLEHLSQGLKLGQTLQTGTEISRRDDSTPVALIYGNSKEARAILRAMVCVTDLLYVLRRTYALPTLNDTDEGRTLKRLVADVYKKAGGRKVALGGDTI
jgi:hypothetical protein